MVWIVFSAENEIFLYERQTWDTRSKLTSKGFHHTNILLNKDKNFKLRDGENFNGKLPLPWKRFFTQGKTIDKKETTTKEFKSTLNKLKRLAPDKFGKILPFYME